MQAEKRNHYIDFVKAIAIFLMLWGHCLQYCIVGSGLDFYNNPVFKTIYSFHMPLFMLVSGYLFYPSFCKKDLKELLIAKVQGLVHPIVFCSFFTYLVTTALVFAFEGKFDIIFDGGWLKKLPSIWFLWSVLASVLATATACKITNRLSVQILLLFLFLPVISLFPNADKNLFMYPYFILGFYFAKYKDKIPPFVMRSKYLCLPLFPVLLFLFDRHHYIYTSGLFFDASYSFPIMTKINLFRYGIGLIGSIFTLIIARAVFDFLQERMKKAVNCFSFLGRNSIKLYTMSIPFLSFYLDKYFPDLIAVLKDGNIFAKNLFVYSFVFTFLLAIVYAILLSLIVKLFDRTGVSKFLYGR